MTIGMSWIFLALFAGVSSNISNFFSRYLLKDQDDSTVYAWYFEAVRFIFFLGLVVFDFKLIVNPTTIALLLAMGATEFISVYYYMKMHAYAHLSISTIISRTRMIWVPIIAFIVLSEKLSFFAYFGIAVLFFGLLIATAPKKLQLDKGQFYAYLSSFVIAVNIVQLKMNEPFASPTVLILFLSMPTTFLFPFFMKNARKRIKKFSKTQIPAKILSAVANIAAVYLFTVAVKLGPAGGVTALYQSMLVVSVLAGIFILNEKQDIPRKLIGAAITLIGVIILSFI